MYSDTQRGSLWRKWDLHVHTPCSLKQHYGGDDSSTWENFVSDLEGLPEQFSVLGINDYFFVDGYERLLSYREQGRLQNLDAILPVVELRLPIFGGSGSKLSKVNYHVIFSGELSPDIIRQQFLPELKSKVKLRPPRAGASEPDFDGVINRTSIQELGEKIIASAPDDKHKDYGSPIHEGFSNLVFEPSDIKKALNKSYFRGKHLTAIGKTEWADVKWTSPVVATKRSLINEADIVFTAAESVADFKKAREHLRNAEVNSRLLDCSDAHNWSNSDDKDRIGNCAQWIKADPTFEGLRHAVHSDVAYGERTFVGTEPMKVRDVREDPMRYIDRVEIRKREESELDEHWFDEELKFNPGLVAIIGNRGNGKSALTDILGLLGASKTDHYSFLDEEQFRRQPTCKATHFVGRLRWRSGDEVERRLDEQIPDEEVEGVRYIPQGYFEEVCNEIIRGNTSEFEQEINRVVFSHIPEARRLDTDSLDELIDVRTRSQLRAVDQLRAELSRLNRKIVDAERRLTVEHRQSLEAELDAKWDELGAHLRNIPEKVAPPTEGSKVREEISEFRETKSELEEEKSALQEEHREAEKKRNSLQVIRDRIDQFAGHYDELMTDLSEEFEQFEFEVGDLVDLSVDLQPVEDAAESVVHRIGEIEKELDEEIEDSLEARIQECAGKIQVLTEGLQEAAKEYEEYQTELEEWNVRKDELLGRPAQPDSLRGLRRRLGEIDALPDDLDELQTRRKSLTEDIFGKLEAVKDTYRDLHEPVHEFIGSSELIQDEYALNFEVVIRETGFADTFLSKIDQSVRGSFRGREEGRLQLEQLLDETDFEDEKSVVEFCRGVVSALHEDLRQGAAVSRDVDRQLVKDAERREVYDFVFGLEYLASGYELRLGKTSIEHLSPGERGITLLIFYLLVSQDERPLIIDQPEGNLDSQSVYRSLAPCIRKARDHRQVFLVTHSPNLAVVCDAEQIVHASIDKEIGYKVTYSTGAIENPEMNEVSVDILEGTPPAFRDRKGKYHSLRGDGRELE